MWSLCPAMEATGSGDWLDRGHETDSATVHLMENKQAWIEDAEGGSKHFDRHFVSELSTSNADKLHLGGKSFPWRRKFLSWQKSQERWIICTILFFTALSFASFHSVSKHDSHLHYSDTDHFSHPTWNVLQVSFMFFFFVCFFKYPK